MHHFAISAQSQISINSKFRLNKSALTGCDRKKHSNNTIVQQSHLQKRKGGFISNKKSFYVSLFHAQAIVFTAVQPWPIIFAHPV